MYKKKSRAKIITERLSRVGDNKISIYIGVFILIAGILSLRYNNNSNNSWADITVTEVAFTILIAYLAYWFSQRQYVWLGDHHYEEWVCVNCEKVFTRGSTANHFLVFKKKTEFWQIEACNNLEKCDIVRMHEVEWVNNDKNV